MVGRDAPPEILNAARYADTLALDLPRALARADALRNHKSEQQVAAADPSKVDPGEDRGAKPIVERPPLGRSTFTVRKKSRL